MFGSIQEVDHELLLRPYLLLQIIVGILWKTSFFRVKQYEQKVPTTPLHSWNLTVGGSWFGPISF